MRGIYRTCGLADVGGVAQKQKWSGLEERRCMCGSAPAEPQVRSWARRCGVLLELGSPQIRGISAEADAHLRLSVRRSGKICHLGRNASRSPV